MPLGEIVVVEFESILSAFVTDNMGTKCEFTIAAPLCWPLLMNARCRLLFSGRVSLANGGGNNNISYLRRPGGILALDEELSPKRCYC